MKLVYCTMCGDIFSPGVSAPKVCKCGYAFGQWKDPRRGLLEVASRVGADGIRVMGLNNAWIQSASYVTVKERTAEADEIHKEINKRTCAEAHGYLFQTRDCPIIMVFPEKTGDVIYNDELLKPAEVVGG